MSKQSLGDGLGKSVAAKRRGPLSGYTICVYGGASQRGPGAHRDLAAAVGQGLGQAGADFVFGGGKVGLMGASSLAAQREGSAVTGVITRFLLEMEAANRDLAELIVVETMHQRKNIMMQRADAFVILPGGFGTLEEVMEVVTLKQLGQLDKPIIFADFGGFWQPLVALFDHFESQDYLHNRFEDLYSLADSPEQIISALVQALAGRQPVTKG
jgi:uncharacterized protein (TIGR00730 family)